jgi:tRNA-binding EMAP/Myf-like protein
MTITYEDFKKLDLRVATILSIEKIPGKTRILKGQIDLGDEIRDVIVGGADFFEPEELLNKTVILLFSSGKLVCTGAKKEPDVYRSVNNLHSLLEEKSLMHYQ